MYNELLASLYRAFVFSIALHNKSYAFIFYRLPVFVCNVAVAVMHA